MFYIKLCPSISSLVLRGSFVYSCCPTVVYSSSHMTSLILFEFTYRFNDISYLGLFPLSCFTIWPRDCFVDSLHNSALQIIFPLDKAIYRELVMIMVENVINEPFDPRSPRLKKMVLISSEILQVACQGAIVTPPKKTFLEDFVQLLFFRSARQSMIFCNSC